MEVPIMKKRKQILFLLVFILAMASLAGCSSQTENSSDSKKPPFIKTADMDPDGGADAADNGGDNQKSKYYKINDFYNMKDDKDLTIIEHYKPILQTTEWSCGVSMASGVLYNLGIKDYTEETCSTKASSNDKTGTSLDGLVALFQGIPEVKIVESAPYGPGATEKPPTFSAMSLYTSENKDDSEKYVDNAKDSYFVKWLTSYLKKDIPIMVDWSDWGGHWQAIIGYDTNGTAIIGDDVLIFADPYDTTDHWQDGYYTYPLERFFYQWKEGFEPYQEQVFIVVEPTKK